MLFSISCRNENVCFVTFRRIPPWRVSIFSVTCSSCLASGKVSLPSLASLFSSPRARRIRAIYPSLARYSRLELTLYNTFVIRIDECASPSRALLHLGERWPTIEGASGCSPFSLARHDSSSDPPGLTNTTLNLPCVRSLTVKPSCIARGDTCPPLLSLFHIHFLFLPILPSLLLELFATYLFEKDLI